jgi:hypothetical protein
VKAKTGQFLAALFAVPFGAWLADGGAAGGTVTNTTTAIAAIELRDQYNIPRCLVFPATNDTVLKIADRNGSGELTGRFSR